MRTCLHCQHWRFSETNQAGERMPGWMIRHGMAACAQGLPWEALPGRNVCGNGQFSGRCAKAGGEVLIFDWGSSRA